MYAPTNEPKNSDKAEGFISLYKQWYKEVSERDVMLVLGGFNASRVGNDVKTWHMVCLEV